MTVHNEVLLTLLTQFANEDNEMQFKTKRTFVIGGEVSKSVLLFKNLYYTYAEWICISCSIQRSSSSFSTGAEGLGANENL